MTVESAVAIAGGFSPRARRDHVTLTHTDASGSRRVVVPPAPRSARAIPSSSANAGSDPWPPDQPLRILHAVRAPVGGIFRHILDLANGQVERGHHVGIIADSLTGGERAEAALAEIAPRLKLGVHRLADPPRTACRRPDGLGCSFTRLIRQLKPDVLHGHGAKAGAFVRLAAAHQRQHSRLHAAWRFAALSAATP